MGGLTLGAIGAALIAAVVSLIGLILGKEQKTSEFRQEWINSLRSEISEYVTNVTAISDQVKIEFENNNEKLKHLIPYYAAVNSAANSIKLRLNPNERHAQEILELMTRIEAESTDDRALASPAIQGLEDKLIAKAQSLLKSEWARVKSGERAFRVAKYSAIVILLALVGTLVIAVLSPGGNKSATPNTEPSAVVSPSGTPAPPIPPPVAPSPPGLSTPTPDQKDANGS